jgi:hypothetical protein
MWSSGDRLGDERVLYTASVTSKSLPGQVAEASVLGGGGRGNLVTESMRAVVDLGEYHPTHAKLYLIYIGNRCNITHQFTNLLRQACTHTP